MPGLALAAICGVLAGGCGRLQTSASTAQDDAKSVTCELRCDWTSDGLIANLAFKNVSDGEVKLPKRTLLLGDEATELTWSPFEITHRGARIPFGGKSVQRTAPTAADYHVLAPGEVVNATVNVGNTYDVSAPGPYRIRYASVNFAPESQSRIDIASNAVEIAKPGSP
jgi:hypothetical protein